MQITMFVPENAFDVPSLPYWAFDEIIIQYLRFHGWKARNVIQGIASGSCRAW